MSSLQQFTGPGTNSIVGHNIPIIQQANVDLAENIIDDVLSAIDEETTKQKWIDLENRNNLKEGELRVADGLLTSTFMVPLKSFSNLYETVQRRLSDVITQSAIFKIHREKDPNVREVQLQQSKLGHKLQTLCSYKEIKRSKRFVGTILFAILSIITVIGIQDALASSSRLVKKEDVSLKIDVSKEKLELERMEIKRSQNSLKRITDLEKRLDAFDHNTAIDEFVHMLKQTVENENRELDSIINPESYVFEHSLIMERIASDILNFFSNKSDDLFDHVLGTGITEVMYFTTFNTIILQSESSNSCEDAHAMIVANTIIPNRNVVGFPTEDPQKFETEDGKYVYVAKEYISAGSEFRPANSLASQRMIMSSPNIGVTVLNNTVFLVDNQGLHLDIVISCPNKPLVQETLYSSPFLRLHTSCEITSEHLNISSFSKDYIHDDIAVKLDFYDLADEDNDFNIGYHKTPIDNKHDITEMFELADDIFRKKTGILQHEMKRLETTSSIGRMLQKVGNTVSEWFNTSLHKIVGIVATVVGVICGIMLLVVMLKCCK